MLDIEKYSVLLGTELYANLELIYAVWSPLGFDIITVSSAICLNKVELKPNSPPVGGCVELNCDVTEFAELVLKYWCYFWFVGLLVSREGGS